MLIRLNNICKQVRLHYRALHLMVHLFKKLNAHRINKSIAKLGNDVTSHIRPIVIPMPRHDRKEDEEEGEFSIDRVMKLRSK